MSFLSSAAARLLHLPLPTTPRVEVERRIRLPAADGIELLTDVYIPQPLEPRPAILIRSPYGRGGLWGLFARALAERGYPTVVQSCRGTAGSVNVCDGILRCGPGTAQPVRVDLWPTAHRFGRGHRLRLQVSGGAHPRFARNLGTGEPPATGTRLAASDRTVAHDPQRASSVALPIL